MKNIIFGTLILLLYKIVSVTCKTTSAPSNYTLNYLLSLNENPIRCSSNDGCPFGSYCNENYCFFDKFLCSEDEKVKCLYVYSKIYDLYNQVEFSNDRNLFPFQVNKPILKSCTKLQVANDVCSTEKCTKNEDCYSGICEDGNCVTEKAIYVCGSSLNSNSSIPLMTCGKQGGMNCDENSECYYNKCNVNYCEGGNEIPTAWKFIGLCIVAGVVLVLGILFCICCCCWCCRKQE